jgi:hypothetical protein
MMGYDHDGPLLCCRRTMQLLIVAGGDRRDELVAYRFELGGILFGLGAIGHLIPPEFGRNVSV